MEPKTFLGVFKDIRRFEMEDKKIVDLYWERSESAIEETAKKYDKYCSTISYNILKNEEDAKECVNDAYLKTWNSIPENRPTFLSSYLGKIVRNLSLNVYRLKTAKKRAGEGVDVLLSELEECLLSTETVESEIETIELSKLISAFLRRQKKEVRLIFVRRYWYMDSIEEISKRYGFTEGKIKSTLFRCRNGLREYLLKEGVAI